jgi:hypothetical protein
MTLVKRVPLMASGRKPRKGGQWHRRDGAVTFILAPNKEKFLQVLLAEWLLPAQTVGHQRDLGK